ncbi:serine/threonine protein kinase [Calothrix sp. NIES-4071]|nr:serine/threonine protein kinase [Calothrix sp. NIES-4071]BAZ54842.1 serine/threonine protein kinase [Calothrix sp. NIES-4105]
MLCCLNTACRSPSVPNGTKYCPNCGVPLVVLRNRYCPIEPLGGGGFGKTYSAEDIDKLNEKCVIKQFAPQVQGTAGIQKATELFEQEARRLQQLGEHPQIPTLLAYFKEDNRLYLVQQFIDGQNLLQELQQQGLFSEEKIRILLRDLLNILLVVHSSKVIHRDIKPENIIKRGDGKLVLIDFGASKQVTQTVITGQGTMIGSLGYASLEQMHGGEAYPASDLFSLGATCFHLLSGIHPWELWKSQGYGWVRNWRQHLQQPVSEELARIIDKLLKEDKEQRYQSTREVLEDLNIQPKEPVPTVKPVGITQPTQSLALRIISIPKLFIILPVIMFIGVGVLYLQERGRNAETIKSQGIEQPSPETTETATEQPSPETIETATEQLSPATYNNRGLEKYNKKDYRGAIEDYSQAIKINPNYAIAYYNRGLARYYLGENQIAIQDYSQAIKLNPRYTNAYFNRGLARYNSGQNQAAIEDYSQAIKFDPNYTDAYYNRGLARYALGDNQAAVEDYSQAIKFEPNNSNAYTGRGLARYVLGDNQAAIEDYNRAIKLDPNNSKAYYNRGLARYTLGDNQTAIEDYNKAIQIDPNYASAYFNRGLARSVLGNKQTAIQDYRKAADLYKQQGQQTDSQNALNRVQELQKAP